MAIKWKKSDRFKPEVVLRKIDAARLPGKDGKGFVFTGFELHKSLPALHSMLSFPEIAKNLDKASLVWRAMATTGAELNATTFLKAINTVLTAELSQREDVFHVLTTVSLRGVPVRSAWFAVENARVKFLQGGLLTTKGSSGGLHFFGLTCRFRFKF